jgi:nitrite reductase (NADH) large subunit
VDALPESAQICSCNNVSKGQLCAGGLGATTIGDLKACTKAGTACGGCVPLVTQVMKAEMKKQGMAVNNHVCEHFPYSRQELHHLVRVGQIKSFDELLAKHGKGLGCDICKPMVASILASCWNDFVLKKEHASLQDSNDYFLGNIQKDGTYSVVPRMAGGEVTPDGLIAVGQVAKKYGLYTKITGGQRVDLFGARVEQLPDLGRTDRRRLRTGHAYGKSLRTVKSCVGSTWCRYGVDDSVGFAVRLENRYKGLRAPHKIKFGVSGCTRECAEAQGKDVGIIATDKGWNLYVCGNGGMKPRHAELIASDLDEATLIRYVDRFLMFYVRTADRLQRTSTWRDNLEGGLDYLKSVVIDDKLGIAAELEARCSTWSTPTSANGRRPSPIPKRASASATSSTARRRRQHQVRRGTRPDPPGHGGREEAARYSRRRRDRLNIRKHQEPGMHSDQQIKHWTPSATWPRSSPTRAWPR